MDISAAAFDHPRAGVAVERHAIWFAAVLMAVRRQVGVALGPKSTHSKTPSVSASL
ncbi:MAG: hypothetical protein R3B82_09845 [Sandaracinaceae bacterium]